MSWPIDEQMKIVNEEFQLYLDIEMLHKDASALFIALFGKKKNVWFSTDYFYLFIDGNK